MACINSFDSNQPPRRDSRLHWASAIAGKTLRRVRPKPKPRPVSEFIPLKETLRLAKAAGLSVGEYLERRRMSGGQTSLEQTIDGLTALGLFNDRIERICEIGPGSGRCLEQMLARCRPRHYEIYETSGEWRRWLVGQYRVAARDCDGRRLAQTDSGSVGLVHSYKLCPALPFLLNVSYFHEMARVACDEGWIVFDAMTERCFSNEHLTSWFEANPWEWGWEPHLIGRSYTVDLFAGLGASLIGSFLVPIYPAFTECMVFRKGSHGL